MAHLRQRHLLGSLEKRRKLWPILGVLGPRQIGKSTFLRDELLDRWKGKYVTMDLAEIRQQAKDRPDYFLASYKTSSSTLFIDEVQKAPALFDALKASIDQKRSPGQFVISGSTEFSKKLGIREALTGRIGLARLYGLTLAEINQRPFSMPLVDHKFQVSNTAEQMERYLTTGGMPGICFLRDPKEREDVFNGWLETTAFRDIEQVQGRASQGSLTYELLQSFSGLEEPTAKNLSVVLHTDVRRVQRVLDSLVALFVLQPLEPFATGKTLYVPFDVGLCNHLGMPLRLKVLSMVLNETLAQYEYSGNIRPILKYYRSPKGSYIDLIIKAKKF